MFTVKRAAELTGLTPATLRVWEQRYGVGPSDRTAAGYRLYDDRAIGRLRAMKALVDAGTSPREAALRLAEDGERSDATDPAGAVDALGRRVVDAAQEMDGVTLESALDEAFARGEFEATVDEWLMPLLRHVGDRWARGELGVATEHVLSATVQRRLGGIFDATPDAADARRAAVGLPRGCRHELGALAAATALRRAGVATTYAGADLPVAGWLDLVDRLGAAAIVVAVPTPADVVPARDTVDALVTRPGLLVCVGGGFAHQVGGAARVLQGPACAAASALGAELRAAVATA